MVESSKTLITIVTPTDGSAVNNSTLLYLFYLYPVEYMRLLVGVTVITAGTV